MIIQNFKDRKKELRELREILDSDKFEFIIIYGRRRIGKTSLILEATKNMNRIYYLAIEQNNLERFYNVCRNHFPEIKNLRMDYEALFEYLKDRVDVVIIDEFQNIIKEDKSIISLFQAIIDNILINSKIKLFILGSSISIISSRVLSYKSPLYGRKTGSIKLKPVRFIDLREFFPNAKIEELLCIYGFTDGIPYYLTRIDTDFWKWLSNELIRERTFLKDEVEFLMRYEFEDPGTYKSILEAIAFGNTKISEIKNFIKAKRTDITPYLRNLIEIGLIERIVPITENIKSRNGRYYITDNFTRFWFRFIYPNISSIEEGIFDINQIKREYNTYLGSIFEKVCKQLIINGIIPFKATRIGKWWHKEQEIDIVAINENTKEILLAECKWKNNVKPEKILKELEEKAKNIEWNKNKRREIYTIFAKNFKEKIREYNNKKVYCIDLKDIEKYIKKTRVKP